MKVPAIICKKCGDLIFSRAQHDYRTCSCGSCSIDGGFEPCHGMSGNHKDIKLARYCIPTGVTKAILYNDWNRRIDKYGLIKNFKQRKSKKINENKKRISE